MPRPSGFAHRFADRIHGSVALGTESTIENVVRYPAALGDAFGLVECPVNAEVDAALAIFFFSLGKRREAAGHVRTRLPIIPFRDAVEFVGNKSKAEFVGPIEAPEGFEQRASEPGMSGRISWKGRR